MKNSKVKIKALVAKAQEKPEEGWTVHGGTSWPGSNTRDHPSMIQVQLQVHSVVLLRYEIQVSRDGDDLFLYNHFIGFPCCINMGRLDTNKSRLKVLKKCFLLLRSVNACFHVAS